MTVYRFDDKKNSMIGMFSINIQSMLQNIGFVKESSAILIHKIRKIKHIQSIHIYDGFKKFEKQFDIKIK